MRRLNEWPRRRTRDGGRRQLQWTLGSPAAIPFASGLAGMLIGPSALPRDNSVIMASLDSGYRFTNAFWFASAPVIWFTLARVERDPTAFRAMGCLIVAAGLARLLAWRRSGRLHPLFVAGLGLELVAVPALLAWQHHVCTLANLNVPTTRASCPREMAVRI